LNQIHLICTESRDSYENGSKVHSLYSHCTYVGPFWFDECEKVETFSGHGLITGTINFTLNSGIFEGVCLVDKSCTCN